MSDTDAAAMSAEERAGVEIASVRLIVGLEIHVELRTRTKMFTSAPNPAHPDFDDAEPNTLLDPVVMALPGSLPVVNREAVELSMRVGLALGCKIAEQTKWDRKGYQYPDLPKGYQISQYDLPLCFDGVVDVPAVGEDGEADWLGATSRIGIIRAHLEEDAGKLLHEAPGGGAIDYSIVDLNRAGTPLLEIVTAPDFVRSDQVVVFCRMLRSICRHVGATEGVMQRGHMRFEPNINCELTLAGGRTVRTPVVEVKNLNSFRAVKGAIEYELSQQPGRWREDGRVMGPGAKSTRGWDDARGVTVPQREKEDSEDYRYFPDPDLPTLRIEPAWRERAWSAVGELPAARTKRYIDRMELTPAEAAMLADERALGDLFDGAVDGVVQSGVGRAGAAKAVANLLLQHGARLGNERGVAIYDVGIDAAGLAGIATLREAGKLGSARAGDLFEKLCDPEYRGRDAEGVAEYEGWLTVSDTGQLSAWCDEVIAQNAKIVEQIRGGKQQAVGRLIGAVMNKSGGSADAAAVRGMLLEKIG
ncbi:MAG: Asp-tRNA(Asn)/Glu-tRNA(Gln) amidotransferase subunit GatB [Planctomycetota bacterium]